MSGIHLPGAAAAFAVVNTLATVAMTTAWLVRGAVVLAVDPAPGAATAAAVLGRPSALIAAASDVAPAALVLVQLVLAAGWRMAKR